MSPAANSFDRFQLVVFRTPLLGAAAQRFQPVYAFWKSMWTVANGEMGKATEFNSDTLTRQHEILVLFEGERPVACVCHRYANLDDASTYDDSYFAHSWTPKETDLLKAGGGLGLLGSQIAIDPSYRKLANDVGLKQLISYLSISHGARQGADVILGRMRVNRGMEKAFYEAGAVCLKKEAPYFDVTVDLVAFYPKTNPIHVPAEYRPAVDALLSRAEVLTSNLPAMKSDQKSDQKQENFMTKRFEQRIENFAQAIENVDWTNKTVYAAYMAQTFYYVRHSTRILALAASRFDLASQKAHQRFLKHTSEESSHEKLAERDVKALGFEIADFVETPSIRAFYQVQYFNVEHSSPWAVMGFILALEGLAVKKGKWLADLVSKAHGSHATNFLKVHAEEDIDHLDKAFELVEGLPQATLEEIDRAMEVSCHLYVTMLNEISALGAKRTADPAVGKKAA